MIKSILCLDEVIFEKFRALNLDCSCFRIFVHIVRRIGKKETYSNSFENIAKVCRISKDNAKKKIKILIKHNLIQKEQGELDPLTSKNKPNKYRIGTCFGENKNFFVHWFIDLYGLLPEEFYLLCYIAKHDNGEIKQSRGKIEESSMLSKDQIDEALKNLVKYNILRKEEGQGQKPHFYKINEIQDWCHPDKIDYTGKNGKKKDLDTKQHTKEERNNLFKQQFQEINNILNNIEKDVSFAHLTDEQQLKFFQEIRYILNKYFLEK